MIRVFALLGALVAPVVVLAPTAEAQKVARAKANLVSKKHKFAMYLPVKPAIGNKPLFSNGGGTLTSFVARTRPVTYIAIVTTMPANTEDVARANYFEMMQKQWTSGGVKVDGLSNVRLTGARDTIINGRRARDIVLSCALRPPGTSRATSATLQLLVFKEGLRVYMIGAAVPTDQRAKYRSQIHRVLGSVRIYK